MRPKSAAETKPLNYLCRWRFEGERKLGNQIAEDWKVNGMVERDHGDTRLY